MGPTDRKDTMTAADVSVRPAIPEDADAVTRLQVRAWRSAHAAALGEGALERLDVAVMRERWAAAIARPPSRDHLVLVACAGPRVVGVATSVPVPGDEPGIEVAALEVDPDHQRQGHGSRLLTACVDLARERSVTHLQTWCLTADGAREAFLDSCGLGPDGARRVIGERPDAEGVTEVTERRWVAAI